MSVATLFLMSVAIYVQAKVLESLPLFQEMDRSVPRECSGVQKASAFHHCGCAITRETVRKEKTNSSLVVSKQLQKKKKSNL